MTTAAAEPATHPLVAIITPVYNGGKFLEETMECVQKQTYPNLVHVVLDNCSKDNTAEIIEKYKDAKIPVLAYKNEEVLPIVPNWNAAFGHTPKDAKYIRLLCADDTMTPDFIEKTVAVAEKDDSISAVCTRITKNDDPVDFSWPDQEVMDGDEVVRRFFKAKIGFFAVHSLMRADVLELRTPFLDASYVGFDFEVFLALLKDKKMGMVHEELGWVRIHAESQTSTVMLSKNTHFADWYSALYQHGKDVFTDEEFQTVSKNYERYYLGKCRGWKRAGGDDIVKFHKDRIAEVRSPVTLWDEVDSLVHGAMVKLGARPGWTGWPN